MYKSHKTQILEAIKDQTKFGLLTPLNLVTQANAKGHNIPHVVCSCECGTKDITASVAILLRGKKKSCGCLKPSDYCKRTHGQGGNDKGTRTKTYNAWDGMKQRCNNPNRSKSHLYLYKGITYDPKWETFEGFFEEMGESPEGFSLERLDGNANYCKENCVWADSKTQANNTTQSVRWPYRGQMLTLIELAEIGSIPLARVRSRLYKLNWTVEDAVHLGVKEVATTRVERQSVKIY